MESQPSQQVQDIIAAQAEFVDVKVIGEYEAPEWEVDLKPGV